jgi:hypothetical protein
VFINVLNIKNEDAIIINVDKWFVPIQTTSLLKIESEFFGDCETI